MPGHYDAKGIGDACRWSTAATWWSRGGRVFRVDGVEDGRGDAEFTHYCAYLSTPLA